MVTSAIQSVLSLLILIVIGYILAGRAWYPARGTDFLSKLCVWVAIPCHMFYSTVTTIKSKDELITLFRGLPVPFFTILASLCLGLVLARVMRIDPSRRGVFLNAVTFSNTVLIGFVIVEAIFGEQALPDAMVYYMANTTLFWTIGNGLLRRDGSRNPALTETCTASPEARPAVSGTRATGSGGAASASAPTLSMMDNGSGTAAATAIPAGPASAARAGTAARPHRGNTAWKTVRSILSPPLVAFILAIVLTLAEIRLPDFILTPIMSLRQMTTPLAMIFIGGIIHGTDFRRTRISRDLTLVMVVRFLLTPVVMLLVLSPLPITTQMKQIFFLMSTMPAMTQLGIMSKESGSDCEYASLLVTVTTAFSMLSIPVYIYILERLQIF